MFASNVERILTIINLLKNMEECRLSRKIYVEDDDAAKKVGYLDAI